MRLSFTIVVAFTALLIATPARAELHFLTPDQLNPALLLPPPPAPDSDTTKAELAELEKIQSARTDSDFARAAADGKNETPTLFADTLGPAFDLTRLTATAHLLDEVVTEEKAAAKIAKKYFARTRPYAVDSVLKGCEKPGKHPDDSYPSGHATLGFSVGVVLASLVPSKAQVILARSADYAHERLVCSVHYRSDIVAGQVLGTVVAIDLMRNKDFGADYNAAERELRAAQLQ